MGTLEASSVLITALQSFSQALMNDGKEIAEEIDAFLGPIEDEKSSLVSKITTLDAQLTTARDRILRISA
jgi:molecular chaperone GrpE